MDRAASEQGERSPATAFARLAGPRGPAESGSAGRAQGPARRSSRVGLDRPFFDDKNRAFWVLQSIGWSGYLILRSLSGLANSMARCSSSIRCC
jgi:hypothetical protein